MTNSIVNSDSQSVAAFYSAAYGELRRLARGRLACRGRDAVLNTTALVHDSYVRLAEAGNLNVKDQFHFMAYAARAMRSVIVDLFRRRSAERRGSAAPHVPLDTQVRNGLTDRDEQVLRVHDALQDLAKFDTRMVQIVEMRYFAGMTEPEIAQVLGVTDRTVRREWEKARLWLAEALA